MTASTSDIKRLRRMVDEQDATTYSDEELAQYLETWPLVDSDGRNYENTNWSEGYDLHAAAADIWDEKAASYAKFHNFSADGSSFSANQMYENAKKQSNHHRALQKAQVKVVATLRRSTYYPEYANPVFDEDEELEDWTDSELYG